MLKISPVAAVPDGFLGFVVQVSSQAGLVVVATSRATLGDEYSSYGASLSVPINSASVTPVFALPGVKLGRPTVQDRAVAARPVAANPTAPDGTGLSWTGQSLVLSVDTDLLDGQSPQGEDATVTSGPVAHLEGSVTLTPQLSASVAVPDVIFHMSGQVDADLSGQFGVHLSTQKSILLAEIGDAALDTPIGPQDLTFSVYATFDTNGSVGVSFEAGYHQSIGTNCTVNFLSSYQPEDGCTASHQDSGSSLDVKSALYGSMDVKAGLQFGVSWQIEDVAGPQLTLSPWVEATEDTSENPWQDISIGASVGMAVEVLQDCAVTFCLPGAELWSNPSLLDSKLLAA